MNTPSETTSHPRPANPDSALARFITHPWFERFIIAVIVLNAITLGLETSKTVMGAVGPILQAIDRIVLFIFVAELIARMIVFRGRFWTDPWSLFDFSIVAITLIPATGNLSVFRALRILRALRLVSAVPSVRRVVEGLLRAIPSMGSVILLLLLINYIFAVITTKLYGADFDEMFGSIGASFYTLFQIMTLEGWSGDVVRPVMAKHPFAWAVFVPYIVIVTFAVLNLFIGIIVDAMQTQSDETREAVEETREKVIAVSDREYRELLSQIGELRDEMRRMRLEQTKSASDSPTAASPAPPEHR